MPRPRKNAKTGTPSWRPASLLPAADVGKGYRARWINMADDANVQKKLAEGWELVSNVNSPQESHDISGKEHQHSGTINDGKPLSSLTRHRELGLARMPEETAQARTEYYQEQSRKQISGTRKQAEREMGDALSGMSSSKPPLHGKTVIE